ncbi:MAG: DNA processing protein DprA, partial [Acidobacteriota bacterium]|nr:DNA processing protein DprA [Acidobacteriota bacterium]
MPPENLLDWVALHLLPGLGPISIGRGLERFSDPGDLAFRTSPAGLATLPGVGPKTVAAIVEARKDLRPRAEREIRSCERRGIRLVLRRNRDYPAALLELPDAP